MPSTLPANPILAWGIVIASILVAIAPIITSRIRDKLNPTASHIVVSHTTADAPAAAQPQLDAGNALLATLVANLEKRTQSAEQRAVDLIEENASLQQRLAKAEERIATLTTQVQVLTDRLIQRGGQQ